MHYKIIIYIHIYYPLSLVDINARNGGRIGAILVGKMLNMYISRCIFIHITIDAIVLLLLYCKLKL